MLWKEKIDFGFSRICRRCMGSFVRILKISQKFKGKHIKRAFHAMYYALSWLGKSISETRLQIMLISMQISMCCLNNKFCFCFFFSLCLPSFCVNNKCHESVHIYIWRLYNSLNLTRIFKFILKTITYRCIEEKLELVILDLYFRKRNWIKIIAK